MIDNINWYPGHMKKTRELIQENLKLVDCVIEVIDSRIPLSSRNPLISRLTGGKERVIILNKRDLADPEETEAWKEELKKEGYHVLTLNSMTGEGLKNLYSLLSRMEKKVNKERVNRRFFRLMIVGIPNVGKSSLINRLTGRKAAQTGDRPGVTKGKQWLTMENGMQLLDTPGILWPKFENKETALNLGFCGSIKDEIMPMEDMAFEFIERVKRKYPQALKDRYKLEAVCEDDDSLKIMEEIALKRGFLMRGKKFDYERTARTLLDEFRSGKLGLMTLERVQHEQKRERED